jgi:diaminohydroxyphosphoribosylaminopyrimidine deaminase/5-amino-6-(5-phosphoribosylamino)uracil reductase
MIKVLVLSSITSWRHQIQQSSPFWFSLSRRGNFAAEGFMISTLLGHGRRLATSSSKRHFTLRSTNDESSSLSSLSSSSLSADDRKFLSQALEYARIGLGHTFPNPAVGCVLVRQDTSETLGAGFHPRAGYPHAEIFALLEAAGHVRSGIEAARSVVCHTQETNLQALMDTYAGKSSSSHHDEQQQEDPQPNNRFDHDGPERLFGDCFANIPVTAYVTLEPCCHYGKTPPCAGSLVLAQVDRVVVGVRDPNPCVDGGGVKVLRQAGIIVDMAGECDNDDDKTLHQDCAKLVESFIKRITPKEYDDKTFSHVNGAKRRGLRTIAGRKKADDSLQQVNWTEKVKASNEDEVDQLEIPTDWIERVDAILWKEELVNLRLNKVTNKKKLAKRLGERVAASLGAHVAQSVGHTALLYRPGIPPILDLEELGKDEDGGNE